MLRRPPRLTRTATLFPSPTLFRSVLRDARPRRRRAARADDAHAAERVRPLRARRLAGLAVGGEAVEAPGHARPPRPARPVHQVRGRDARPVVRIRAAEGGPRLGLGGRQLRQSLHARQRLRAAAPRVRRGQRQAGCVGPCDRRHGRDHPGDGEGVRRARVVVETDADVAQLLVEGGKAIGVALADGREFRAGNVVSNLNPKLLYTKLVEPGVLDADTAQRLERYRSGPGPFRMNVELAELPDFTAAPRPALPPPPPNAAP